MIKIEEDVKIVPTSDGLVVASRKVYFLGVLVITTLRKVI